MKSIKRYLGILLFALSLVLSVSLVVPEINGCVDVQAATVKINKTKVSIYIGKSFKLKVTGTKAETTWWSDNENVATVSENTGKVTGKKKGTAVIYGYVNDKALSVVKCKVTVKTIMAVSPRTVTISEGQSTNIKVRYSGKNSVYYDNNNTDIISCKWSKKWSNNYTTLVIAGKSAGQTTVEITNDDNKEKYTINVTVKGKQINTNSFTKLKNYILTYGDTNRAGNKFIYDNMRDDDGYLWTWCIIVNNSNQIEFMVAQDRTGDTDLSSTYGELYIDSNLNAYVKYEYSMFGDDGTVSAIANLNSRTYTENTKLTYNIVENDLYYTSSGIPKIADSMLKVGFAGWDELLDQTGVTFKNLGFSSLVIS